MTKRVTLLLLFFVGAIYVHAQNDTLNIDEAIVTGTKSLVNRNQLPISVTVINNKTIENSSESAVLPVLSDKVPGVFVTKRGVTGFGVSAGSAGTVNIRGVGGGNKVLMLFDGQPQWAGIFGHHLPDIYVTSDIDRIEVIRGPASLLYGSNAMGGVVNMITKKPAEGLSVNSRLMYGSYNTQKYMANTGYSKGKFSNMIAVNHDRTDGHRENSAFHITNGYFKSSYTANQHWKTTADFLIADFLSENPGEESKPMIESWAKALRGTASFSADNVYQKTQGSVKLFYNFGNHKVNDGWVNLKPRDYLFRSNDYNFGGMVYQIFKPFKGNQITSGIDLKRWGGKAWNEFSDKDVEIINKGVNEFAIYTLIQQTIIDKITLNGGLRLEMNETYGNEWVPQVGLTCNFIKNTTFKSSISSGFRSPNIRELYMFAPANPDLKPEEMINYEAGFIHKMLKNKAIIELTGFIINGKNIIQIVPVNGKPQNINTGEFNNKGIEFAFNYNLIKQIQPHVNYSYLHMKKPIAGSPKQQLNISIEGEAGKFQYSAMYKHVNGLYLNSTVNETYNSVDIKTGYRLKNFKLFVKAENITNTKYAINYGFPMPGIVIFGGIDFAFRK